MNKLSKISLSIVLVALSSCTEPGETTYISTATGGVLGAGLGAVIGNQTGDAGSGLAIGGLAGAGAGAAIGNALEAQQKAIVSQDEALERQQKILAAQNAEIQELRGTPLDTSNSIDLNDDARGSLSRNNKLHVGGNFTDQLNSGADIESQSTSGKGLDFNQPVRDRSITRSATASTTATSLSTASLVESDLNANLSSTTNTAQDQSIAKALSPTTSSPETAECTKAEAEIQKADTAKEGADKLFYLRRAIRLCPANASYHKNLADQYLSLGRNEDAKTAYEDAVRLDPALTEAKEALTAISSGNIY
jgi:tetratricopeptide (TPR) repeat protein